VELSTTANMAAVPNEPTDFAASHVEKEPITNGSTNGLNGYTTNGVNTATKNGHTENIHNIDVDVLIVGAGFGGMYGLHQVRQMGLSVKLFDAGSDFGGTWHWNRYPGARVDSETPYYSLSIPKVYKSWHFSERFPGHQELREYFKHVANTLDLRKDAFFNTIVVEAKYSTESDQWTVKTDDGGIAKCKYLVLAVGSSYKKHFPDFKNLDKFKGKLIHSALYPEGGLDVKGKKVGVIGSGATGVQIVQELAREDCQLSAFVRTPNIALPMHQRKLTKEEQDNAKSFYMSMLQSAKDCRSGFPYDPAPKTFFEASKEERMEYWEDLWQRGGFSFLISNYREFLLNKDVNREFYQYWASKVRARISDPFKRDVMAPLNQGHWYGTKRPSLEQDYYEMIDRPNVSVIDLNATPIVEFTETGIHLGGDSPKHHDFDIIILATGYDSVTGSLIDMNLTDINNVPLTEKWAKGTYTHLGLMIPKMPNMFMVYSPQAPTSLSNGPPIIEIQIDWICDAIRKMREEGIRYVDGKQERAEQWREDIQKINSLTLYPETNSWYM
jgi:cation diffusion facilitator CzcD-associated flavoprotein CzcO